MIFLGKKNLLETMNVAVDVLLEIGHAPAPVDQEQSCREQSADCQSCCLEALSSFDCRGYFDVAPLGGAAIELEKQSDFGGAAV
jgi:hypothetical protein